MVQLHTRVIDENTDLCDAKMLYLFVLQTIERKQEQNPEDMDKRLAYACSSSNSLAVTVAYFTLL